MAPTTPHQSRLVRLATAYDSDGEPSGEQVIQFALPEDLSTVEGERLGELLDEAEEAFDAVYGEGDGDYSDDEVAAMNHLAQAAEAIREEQAAREERAEENRRQAADAAARFRPGDDDGDEPEASDDDGDDEPSDEDDEAPDLEAVDDEAEVEDDGEPEAQADDAPEAEAEPEAVAASAQGPISVTLRGVRSRQSRSEPADETPGRMSLVAAAGLGGQIEAGAPTTVDRIAERIDAKGRTLMRGPRTELAIGSIRKPFPDDLVVDDVENRDRLSAAINRAVDEKRLPGGSLTAAAGWCAPSETMYDLAEAPETTEGLLSLPEIQVDRGGVRHTLGPDFSTIFAEDALHFHYTEDEVEGGVSKPCFFVDCPEFDDVRMDVDGICIKAGLLQSRAYPETIARYVEGAPIAHEFHRASTYLAQMTDDSQAGVTSVTFPSGQVGATAPILTAVEIQATDYRQRHRLSDQRTLEAVFPRWTFGAIRSDLSRRLGVDLVSVTDARVREWFAQRGINPQFVYELDDLTGAIGDRTSWPANLTFLLYLGGTWVAGTQAIVELSSVFDAALVEENTYMELFTEEGFLLLQRFHDSRAVTVPICADGATHGGVDIDCDGTAAA